MLIYTGGGWYPDIPARDLTEDEIKELAKKLANPNLRTMLLKSGCYAEPEKELKGKEI
jgi:hypothetical protein